MIISHKNKYTILRVPKTGSTSLEASARMCGLGDKDDICSESEDAFIPAYNIPSLWKDELSKFGQLKSMARNKKKMGFDLTSQEEKLLQSEYRWDYFLAHATLNDLVNDELYSKLGFITEDQIFEYKNYAFVREPHERYLSSFMFYQACLSRRKRLSPDLTIEAFHDFTINQMSKSTNILFRPQVDYFFFNGKRVVEPLIFDKWSSEASRMISGLGKSPLIVYPKFKEGGTAKGSIKGKKPSIDDYINPFPEIKKLISDYFSEDIDFYKEVTK